MNKNIIKNTVLFMGIAGMSGTMTSSLAAEVKDSDTTINNYTTKSQIVDIPDENLKKGINNALGRGEVLDDISIADMESLKSLNVNGKNISNIQGLEHAVNLTTLYLGNNQISDISSLENLTKLITLRLDDNRISNIVPLGNLITLKQLELYSNQISDVSALENLTNLTTLYLNNNQISDISPLENLTNLTTLHLANNQISDISALRSLNNLTNLQLYSNKINDVSDLENLTNLTTLHLSNNQINDVSNLENLTNLTYLNLHNNQVEDLSSLINMQNLTETHLGGNKINDISVFQDLSNLKTLHVHNNKISVIPDLSKLSKLSSLRLDGNQISDISPLRNLTSLTTLYLYGNQISGISPLENLTSLTHLNLSSNQISDISPLESLTSLINLQLSNNQISDVMSLGNLIKLTTLNLAINQISEISMLNNLIGVTWLNIEQNKISDISVLRDCVELKYLHVGHNKEINNIGVLKYFIKLQELYLHDNKINNISALENLTNLTSLRLDSNQISDISSLKNLNKLTSLNLTNQKITKDYTFKTNIELTNVNLNNLIKGVDGENINTTSISNSGYYENGKLYWNNIALGQHRFTSNFNQAIQINTAKTNFTGTVTYNIGVVDGEGPSVDNNITVNEDEFTLSTTITAEDLLSEVDYLMHKGERHSLPYTFEYDAHNRENNIVEVYDTVGNITTYEVTADLLDLEALNELVVLLETNNNPVDKISYIRAIINNMSESSNKDILNERVSNLSLDMTLERKTVSANLDVYIRCENMLSMTLDTNMITFEDFSGVEDMENREAVAVKVNSSLPYQLNAYLPAEIQNADATKILDKSIFNIKESNEDEYKKFTSIGEKIVLKDNCEDGNNITHTIDLKLDSSDAHDADIYKAVIKLEIEQK